MSDVKFLDALQQAKSELEKAIKDRDALNLEILRLQQLVKALSQQVQKGDEKLLVNVGDKMGLTEAVLTILRSSPNPMTARNIRDQLVQHGFELGRYSNPLGFVHSVLGRLDQQGKIRQPQPGVYAYYQVKPINEVFWGAFDALQGYQTKQAKAAKPQEEKPKGQKK